LDKIVVDGGRRLKGRMTVSGSKNAALPIMAATILARGRIQLKNVPQIRDIKSMIAVLRTLGGKAVLDRHGVATISTRTVDQPEAHYELVKTMRASILVLGPLVAALGRARVSLPGGCAIGTRPIDIHLKGLEALGAEISIESGYVVAAAERLRGGNYRLPFASVGATENLMMAASLADGTTVLENCAQEPEIADLGDFINAMGGAVSGAGTATIVIEGRERLQSCTYSVMPDRIEAGTFLVAGAITRGEVAVSPMPRRHLESFLEKMREAGVDLDVDDATESIRARSSGEWRPVEVRTEVFPGFPTDLQAQLMALSTVTEGESVYHETIFENRFMHVAELRRLGADIRIEGGSARVHGVRGLHGTEVMASDLRASAALILAGLVARDRTTVTRVYHIDRGYERFEEKLAALGASIRRNRDAAN
jgi:UDP-N-acetylglucosamine 1-carboxyvinyltransferase